MCLVVVTSFVSVETFLRKRQMNLQRAHKYRCKLIRVGQILCADEQTKDNMSAFDNGNDNHTNTKVGEEFEVLFDWTPEVF